MTGSALLDQLLAGGDVTSSEALAMRASSFLLKAENSRTCDSWSIFMSRAMGGNDSERRLRGPGWLSPAFTRPKQDAQCSGP